MTITYALGNENIPPTVTDRSPAPNATGVNVNSNVSVTFSELMDVATITSSSFRLRRVGDTSDVPAAVTLAGNVATLDPSADLSPATTYRVTVAASVADLAGNTLGADDTWTFTTGVLILSATDTTVADFSAGSTFACVVDASIGDGALRLPADDRGKFLRDSLAKRLDEHALDWRHFHGLGWYGGRRWSSAHANQYHGMGANGDGSNSRGVRGHVWWCPIPECRSWCR